MNFLDKRKRLFLKNANKAHKNMYQYNLDSYKNAKSKVKIKCEQHGWFKQNASNHVRGSGCPSCSSKNRNKNRILDKEQFIIRSRNVHGSKYDYSLVDYKNCDAKVKIVCPLHGVFAQRPYSHYKKVNGCIKCAEEQTGKSLMKTIDEFTEEAHRVHDFKYRYDKTAYTGSRKKLVITCPLHGDFEQIPTNHLRGKGCPTCKSSFGEKAIEKILKKNNLNYLRQKTFDSCKNELLLPFDFFLPDFNVCIEYQGIQHYEPVEFFGGAKNFNKQIARDRIKREFCKKEGITLIEIPYFENIDANILISKILN